LARWSLLGGEVVEKASEADDYTRSRTLADIAATAARLPSRNAFVTNTRQAVVVSVDL
jgi:hypothetical protein